MSDMLVKLYDLPDAALTLARVDQQGIEVRQAMPAEKPALLAWISQHFNPNWAAECEVALNNRPVSCYIAVRQRTRDASGSDPYDLPPEELLGFACYDATRKGMFGPEGVLDSCRGQGVGAALLLACLHAMRWEGYGYAVIGWAGPVDFYAKTVGATVIEGSAPGVYYGSLLDGGESIDQNRRHDVS